MALYSSADCVLRVKKRLNRPATDEVFTYSTADDVIYDALTDAQAQLIDRLAAIVPDAVLGDPLLLTSADGGKTYTFGADVDTASVFPMGHYKLYASLSDIPYTPLIPGADYLVEGTKVRIPSDQSRTFGAGPYAQIVTPGNVISAASEPTLLKQARPVMISMACAALAGERLHMDPSPYLYAADREMEAVLASLRTRNGSSASPGSRNYPLSSFSR